MDTSIICNMKMPWDQLGIHLFSHGNQALPVRGDSFCFLNAIDLVFYCDYEVVMVDSLESSVQGHLVANVDYYKWFHIGDILQYAEGYFKFGNYCDSVINLIITATAKTLNMDLSICRL